MKKGISFWGRAWWQAMVLVFAVAGLGMASTSRMPTPGSVNFMQGQVMLDGHELSGRSRNTAVLEPNQVLDTHQGKAELLLTPGVFLRVGDQSAVKMISPDLADTQVAVTEGSAILEVDELFKENDLAVFLGDTRTHIDKRGLYDFEANPATIAVLDGKATVRQGDDKVKVKKGREVVADVLPLKAKKFDRNALEATSLYRWSKLRSEYEAQANRNAAQNVVVYGGWYGPGWYWAPFWNCYSFLPGAGTLYSPFGFGFYSPIWFGHIWGWGSPYVYGRAPRFGHIGHGQRFGHFGGAPRLGQRFGAMRPMARPHIQMSVHRG
jgi:hypothetical protein